MEYSETTVMAHTGLNKADMRRMRGEMEEGRHWYRKPKKGPEKLWPIFWTEAGMSEIAKVVGLSEGDARELAAAQEGPKVLEGIVRQKYANPRVIRCDLVRDKGYESVMVLVRDSRNFVPGMVVPLRSDGARYIAAKHPRFGGKW